MELTEAQITAAFTEWERRYREDPTQFASDYHRFTQWTEDDYGTRATATLLGYINDAAIESGASTPEPASSL